MNKTPAQLKRARPTDILKAPPKEPIKGIRNPKTTNGVTLPLSWQVLTDASESWPFLDPDENGLADPEPSFADYPAEPEAFGLNGDVPWSNDEPWGRMLSEGDRAWELFCEFRAQGITRSIRQVAEKFELAQSTIFGYAQENNWQARAIAWDDYRERIYTIELLAGVKEMAHRHAEIARNGIESLSVIYDTILGQLSNEVERADFIEELKALPPKTQLAIAQRSGQVMGNMMNSERLARGLPTEITADISLRKTEVTIQPTDALVDIIGGLLAAVAGRESNVIEGTVIEADE